MRASYGDYYDSGPVYEAPSYPYYDSDPGPIVDPVYFSDPYVATPDPYEQYQTPPWSPIGLPDQSPKFGTGLYQFPGASDSPYVPGVSRVGPSASVQPRGPMSPGIPAGSLFASRYGFGGSSRSHQSRGGGRRPAQRGFTVDLQEKLRRRRRGRFFG